MDKVIIITGAASGIGKHLAGSFLAKGYKLMLTDIAFEVLEQSFAPNELLIMMKHDISELENWKDVIARTKAKFGKIDYLFNVAAIIKPGFVYNISAEDIDAHININTKGTMYGIKLMADEMVAQGFGHIINVASLAGVAPIYGISLYSASKYAVRGYSLAVAQELAPKNVYCTVICPDLVNTPMLDQQLPYEDETALTFSGNTPLSVEDIERAFEKAMKTKAIEICVPYSRGLTAKIANFFPQLAYVIKDKLVAKGRRKKAKMRLLVNTSDALRPK